jgi:aspartate racemase
MKSVGIIGGMSWESSLEYYRLLNQQVKAALGGFHSADCIMVSVDFHEIEQMQMAGDWDRAGETLAEAARRLERGGAEVVLLATNTMHLVADAITSAINIPFLHIADATAEAIVNAGINSVALLGTRFTMEKPFMRDHMVEHFGLNVIVPDDEGRTIIHDIIYNELVLGDIRDTSREQYLKVIDRLIENGAEGVILGCTEIGLLIQQEHVAVPVFDTMQLHVASAADFALQRV